MIWLIKPSDTFRTDYRNLRKDIQVLIPDILRSLAEDPFAPFLRTHPLRDHLSGYYACSIDDEYRIIMRISEKNHEIKLFDVGNHDIYKRYV